MDVTPHMLLRAYSCGLFPMAESRDDEHLFWLDPDMRGIIPLDDFHIPRSLKKVLRKGDFEMRCDTAFRETLNGCAETTDGRPDTWISERIKDLYIALHEMGHAHSIETWSQGELVGGLYGVHIGGAFFGESMFSRRTDASKVALVHLVARLCQNNFRLLDTQFVTSHLGRFGAREIPRRQYQEMLLDAINRPILFPDRLDPDYWAGFLQSTTQTS